MSLKPHMRRFYETVDVQDCSNGYLILLDGKTVVTPAKANMIVPRRNLAKLVQEEWQTQGDHIDLRSMPMTSLVNTAIDAICGREEAVREEIAAYAGSDLICYPAEGPDGLIENQKQHWDPVLGWLRDELGVNFRQATGISHVEQPEAAVRAIAAKLRSFDTHILVAMHVITSLTGSILLTLALVERFLTCEQAWAAANVDEDWQVRNWGADAEAITRRENRWRDMQAACKYLELVYDQDPVNHTVT